MELEKIIDKFQEDLSNNGFNGFKLKIVLIENEPDKSTNYFFEYNIGNTIKLVHMRIFPYGDCYNYRAFI